MIVYHISEKYNNAQGVRVDKMIQSTHNKFIIFKAYFGYVELEMTIN